MTCPTFQIASIKDNRSYNFYSRPVSGGSQGPEKSWQDLRSQVPSVPGGVDGVDGDGVDGVDGVDEEARSLCVDDDLRHLVIFAY